MLTFARFNNDVAVDVTLGGSLAEVEARYHPALIAKWGAAGAGFVSVPEGTLPGAVRGGEGGITNPPPFIVMPEPRKLTRNEFIDHVCDALGGYPDGTAKFEVAIAAARASTQVGIPTAIEKYDGPGGFERDEAARLLALFVTHEIGGITQAEINNIINTWPMS